MNTLEDMKADAEVCNTRARRIWGLNSFVVGQAGIVRKQSTEVMTRREKVWEMHAAGMSNKQISEATGLTLSTVKSDVAIMRAQVDREAA